METLATLAELSVDELVRIREQLQRRFGIGQRGNIIEVAFGMAERHGELDLARPDAVCFYVRHKRRPRAIVDRIPPTLQFRLKRGEKFVQVCLLTDVIFIGTRQVRPTGEPIVHRPTGGRGTAGGVLVWKFPGDRQWNWGVLTVGHIFSRVRQIPESTASVHIDALSGIRISGTLIAAGLPFNSGQVDAAIVAVERADLIRAKLIQQNVSTKGKRLRSVELLKSDQGKMGFTFPRHKMLTIQVVRFLPISDMVPQLGTLANVVEGVAEVGVFGVGSSGSLWGIAGQVGGIQHGGLPPLFQRGWGQAMELVGEWCRQQLAELHQVKEDQVEVRLVGLV